MTSRRVASANGGRRKECQKLEKVFPFRLEITLAPISVDSIHALFNPGKGWYAGWDEKLSGAVTFRPPAVFPIALKSNISS
jgi:hypothetical protein